MVLNNRFNKIILLIVLFLGMCVPLAYAQKQPIRWRCVAQMTSPTDGVVTVKALIADGWHLYGLTMPEGGPKATAISLGSSTGVKFIGELTPDRKPLVKRDAIFDMDVNYWEQRVEFTYKFKITGSDPKISGSVSYMGCNDETCLPPSTASLSAPIVPLKK